MSKIYIGGVGLNRVGRHFKKDIVDLAYEVSLEAINEAGIEPDAVIISNSLGNVLQKQNNLAQYISSSIGLRGKTAYHVEAGDGSGGAAIHIAYTLLKAKIASSVLVVGVEKMTDYPSHVTHTALSQLLNYEYEAYYGATLSGIAALIMRYYMKKYEVSRDAVSEWPVLMHYNASKNPYAQIRKTITKENVKESQIIADPLTLFDISPIGDGAAAVLLVGEDYEHQLEEKPEVFLDTVVHHAYELELTLREDLAALPTVRETVDLALKKANLRIQDIDVIELHDSFTITGLLILEEAGLAERGRAAYLLSDGRFRHGDKPEVNLSGGLKARGNPIGATGVYQVAEVAMQLRGAFPGLQSNSPEIGLVINMSGIGSSVSSIVIRKR